MKCPSCHSQQLSMWKKEETSRMRGNNYDSVKYAIKQRCAVCGFVNHTTSVERENVVEGYIDVDSAGLPEAPSRFGT